ncbi:Emc10p [Kluyveromyces lactis]|uniref:KLLA0E12629p n=1 Tax=Kluyveromyces lactis (strain ATCC 8585 / CBS 2359 / DSM 70799 / NBRC 1267 / NRRL Y-1140 / WM37) TaxID=284590 RepID=Q6CNH0_KLULA|nr:uncharacterized protein KLLA0_E12629g [Kluyveromyces lactis]CAG99606.1 KLLA0E12629p [Kluyveromyces lactis]|eukprot:XP_454519.1 uncharacterized protein KLLA0_E12629g [Kluyveromyces lactis]
MLKMIQLLLILLFHLRAVVASLQGTGDLYLLNNLNERYSLATFEAGDEVGINLAVTANRITDGEYKVCGTFQDYYDECFSFIHIKQPLSYELELVVLDDKLVRMSIHADDSIDGIVPLIKEVGNGPIPESIKLKKRTLTYEAKKKAQRKDTGTAAFEEDVVENKTFLQKNWKYVVIGLLAYVFLSSGSQK